MYLDFTLLLTFLEFGQPFYFILPHIEQVDIQTLFNHLGIAIMNPLHYCSYDVQTHSTISSKHRYSQWTIRSGLSADRFGKKLLGKKESIEI